jgi:hypothetical protein
VDQPVDEKLVADGSVDDSSDPATDPSADDSTTDDTTTDDTTTDTTTDDGTDPTDDGSTDTSSGGCATDTLKPGAVVTEADVSYTGTGAFFDAIQLAPTPTP